MEEKFFFWYHFRTEPYISMSIPIFERKWYIERFITQKEKENEAMEDAKRKAK
jgi:hypothetical protein